MLLRQIYVIKKYIHIGAMRLQISSMENAFESRDTESYEKDLMILHFSILSIWKNRSVMRPTQCRRGPTNPSFAGCRMSTMRHK